MGDSVDKGLELLFQRPLDPLFATRDNGKASFDLPDSFYTEEYKGVAVEVQSRFGDDVDVKIPLRDVAKPDLNFTKKIGIKKMFSLFVEEHQKIAGRLIKIFMDAPDKATFLATAAYTKDRVNPLLFQYAFSVALQHRDDTDVVKRKQPPIAEQFPGNFIEPSVLRDARTIGSAITNPGDRMHIEIPRNFTASDREQEQRVSYFREDIGVNMHHWHWHLVYPGEGEEVIVKKDRRGELFYYMHHQIIARYNTERFCNLLPRVKTLNNLREAIPEGYFPKLLNSINNRTYPARIEGTFLKDVDRENNAVEVADVERWRDRILQAIDQGFITDTKAQNIPLDVETGIDILGDLIEASRLSKNRQLYGSLHNMGHNLIAISHDPDNRHLEEFGVMGDVTTAMRDPIFYRWHAFIDSVFQKYKDTLGAYDESELKFDGVTVNNIQVKIDSGKAPAPNFLLTFWQKSDVDLAAGLDFGPNGNIFAHFIHLQHAGFTYTITAENSGSSATRGTCRIFICPKTDERGTTLSFNEQRLLMIELDKFTVNLNPGSNIIKRRSDESSVTIPFERSFRRIGPQFQPNDDQDLASFRFCGCGWPQHLLIPKGKPEGMPFDMFVMISDYVGDMVAQPENEPGVCGDAHSFCGLKDKKYPDKRAMGYPFDRVSAARNLEQFISAFSNMKTETVTIRFTDQIVDKQ